VGPRVRQGQPVDAAGKPIAEIEQLLKAGSAVIAADLVYQGEFLADAKPSRKTAASKTREFAGYTLDTIRLFAQRVHDILTLVSFARPTRWPPACRPARLPGRRLAAAARA
jgi:hypothetical protein